MNNIKPRQRIIQTATLLFRQQGFNSTGINQIIKESKVAKASFYDHFKSKDDLAIQYLNERHIHWFEGLNNYTQDTVNTTEKIVTSFEYLKFMNTQENFSGCVFLNILSEFKFENEVIYQIIKNHKIDLQEYFDKIILDKKKSFLIYMLFESCLTESQVYKSQSIIDQSIEILKSQIL